jgi:putative flippase GtrA
MQRRIGLLNSQFLRFIIIGLINTIFGYSIYAILIFVGLTYFYAIGLSTIIGIIFNFKTIGRYVFKSKSNYLIFRFFGVYLFIFIINCVLIKTFINLGLNAYLAGATTVLPMAILSFILNKYFVFNR